LALAGRSTGATKLNFSFSRVTVMSVRSRSGYFSRRRALR
jgi:hypothetical protein